MQPQGTFVLTIKASPLIIYPISIWYREVRSATNYKSRYLIRNGIFRHIGRFIMGANDAAIPGHDDIWVNANATLTKAGSTVTYAVAAGASQTVEGILITPQIWKHTGTGDVLVYTGPTEVCAGRVTCVATGNFTPTDDKRYFVNATALYTVPVITANGVAAGTQQYSITVSTNRAEDPIAKDSWDAQGYYGAYVSHKNYWWRVNIAPAMFQDNLHPDWDETHKYGYEEQMRLDSHQLGRKSIIPNSLSDVGFSEEWRQITNSRIVMVSESVHLHTNVDTDKSHSGGTPLRETGSTLSQIGGIVEPVAEMAICRWKPGLGALSNAKTLATSLIQLNDVTTPPEVIWKEEWTHCAGTCVLRSDRVAESNHFTIINVHIDGKDPNTPRSGSERQTFTISDEVDWVDPGKVDMFDQESTTSAQRTFTHSLEIPKDRDDINSNTYAFKIKVTLKEWEDAMEAA
ncbi:MAG: hypothetical protein METHP_00756 [Methanoregula sp. SKADARSKE-2]|nr:MAG: hypothetical protein METHP_00756 [Methanoregula sp. SKADARSKE-2]